MYFFLFILPFDFAYGVLAFFFFYILRFSRFFCLFLDFESRKCHQLSEFADAILHVREFEGFYAFIAPGSVFDLFGIYPGRRCEVGICLGLLTRDPTS